MKLLLRNMVLTIVVLISVILCSIRYLSNYVCDLNIPVTVITSYYVAVFILNVDYSQNCVVIG